MGGREPLQTRGSPQPQRLLRSASSPLPDGPARMTSVTASQPLLHAAPSGQPRLPAPPRAIGGLWGRPGASHRVSALSFKRLSSSPFPTWSWEAGDFSENREPGLQAWALRISPLPKSLKSPAQSSRAERGCRRQDPRLWEGLGPRAGPLLPPPSATLTDTEPGPALGSTGPAPS